MGLRCSVLGHDYGETGVERERDERGAEVIRTAKRVRTCRNCGHERTVTENTEITALEPEAGVVRDGDGRVVAATAEENVAADGTGSITIEDGTLDGGSPPEDAASEDTAVSLDEIPETDAAALSTDEPASDTAATEHEPDATATEPASDATATEHESDTATDAAATSAESEIPTVETSRSDGPADDPGRAPGEWPADPSAESAGSTGRAEGGSESLTPIGDTADSTAGSDPGSVTQPLSEEWTLDEDETRAKEEAATGTNGSPGTIEPGETFACDQCGFTAAVADSPLRAGDSCPECRTGYLARGTRKG